MLKCSDSNKFINFNFYLQYYYQFVSKMYQENEQGYTERIAISKNNKDRLKEAVELYLKHHPEARHRNITHNEALGIVLDFYFEA